MKLMNFFRKERAISTYGDFWEWFALHQAYFYKKIKNDDDVNHNVLEKLSSKLKELNEGFFILCGMSDDTTAELIITPDGVIKNIPFAEELVRLAPAMKNWKFTALKQPEEISQTCIKMAGYTFDDSNLSFFVSHKELYPDEIEITVVYQHYNNADEQVIGNGVYVFLDRQLGELNFVTSIDNLSIAGPGGVKNELIPIAKLNSYISWRESEFKEKYSGIWRNSQENTYQVMEATTEEGVRVIAVVNEPLLHWESKASHPWILTVEFKYTPGEGGMPDNVTYELLNVIEDELGERLESLDGYLHIGRQTTNGTREIYFACKDFRKPAIFVRELIGKYGGKIEGQYDIYKDKYWRTFEKFKPPVSTY